jgi:hypothetical protein
MRVLELVCGLTKAPSKGIALLVTWPDKLDPDLGYVPSSGDQNIVRAFASNRERATQRGA